MLLCRRSDLVTVASTSGEGGREVLKWEILKESLTFCVVPLCVSSSFSPPSHRQFTNEDGVPFGGLDPRPPRLLSLPSASRDDGV